MTTNSVLSAFRTRLARHHRPLGRAGTLLGMGILLAMIAAPSVASSSQTLVAPYYSPNVNCQSINDGSGHTSCSATYNTQSGLLTPTSTSDAVGSFVHNNYQSVTTRAYFDTAIFSTPSTDWYTITTEMVIYHSAQGGFSGGCVGSCNYFGWALSGWVYESVYDQSTEQWQTCNSQINTYFGETVYPSCQISLNGGQYFYVQITYALDTQAWIGFPTTGNAELTYTNTAATEYTTVVGA